MGVLTWERTLLLSRGAGRVTGTKAVSRRWGEPMGSKVSEFNQQVLGLGLVVRGVFTKRISERASCAHL